MKKTLEKIANSVKKVGKKAVAVGATIVMLYAPVYGSKLKIRLNSMQGGPSPSNSTFTLYHHSLGSVFDTIFPEAFPPALDIYHLRDSSKWGDIGKPADNMETIIDEIEGRGKKKIFL